MSNETRLPVLRPVGQQSQPQTFSSQSPTFTLEQLAFFHFFSFVISQGGDFEASF